MNTRTDLLRLVSGSLALLFAGVWLGGLVVLGAIVAPTVFHVVPMPTSADAMVVVFVDYDKLAMMSAAVVAVAEVVRARSDPRPVSRTDVARLGVIALAGGLAVVQGLWLSPSIVSLHRQGAIRGLGPLGERLERFHSWSETCGKTESLLLVVLIVLLVRAMSTQRATTSEA